MLWYNHMCLLIWTVFSGERCGPWASCCKNLSVWWTIDFLRCCAPFWKSIIMHKLFTLIIRCRWYIILIFLFEGNMKIVMTSVCIFQLVMCFPFPTEPITWTTIRFKSDCIYPGWMGKSSCGTSSKHFMITHLSLSPVWDYTQVQCLCIWTFWPLLHQ